MIEPILVRCPAELKFLQPKFVSNLYRIGNNSDGGYALTVIALSNSDSFFISRTRGELVI
jgi:hypothetical protein